MEHAGSGTEGSRSNDCGGIKMEKGGGRDGNGKRKQQARNMEPGKGNRGRVLPNVRKVDGRLHGAAREVPKM